MSTQSKQAEPLLGSEADELRSRWQSIQSAFVDEPQRAVEQADELVTDVIKRLARTFQETRESLETQLAEAEDVSTEDLRVGLQRYRSFFERLLSA
jgi:molecular chaperone GrpE (heat shock protein)